MDSWYSNKILTLRESDGIVEKDPLVVCTFPLMVKSPPSIHPYIKFKWYEKISYISYSTPSQISYSPNPTHIFTDTDLRGENLVNVVIRG